IRRRELRRKNPHRALRTGIKGLDRALGGGLSGITFLGGCPGIGKTTLALVAAISALKTHPYLAVLFLALDMTKDAMFDRLICHEAGVDYATLVAGRLPKEI